MASAQLAVWSGIRLAVYITATSVTNKTILRMGHVSFGHTNFVHAAPAMIPPAHTAGPNVTHSIVMPPSVTTDPTAHAALIASQIVWLRAMHTEVQMIAFSVSVTPIANWYSVTPGAYSW